MATPDIYHIPPMPTNMNNPEELQSNTKYLPISPMPTAPPPSYPTPMPSAPPPSYPPPLPLSYPMPAPSQPHLYPSQPVVVTHMQVPYPGVVVATNFIPPQTVHIRDYMAWSIINVFLGCFLLGIIAVLLSLQTRKRKQEGDVQGAKTMSKVTLICNIFITIIFFALTAFLIIYFVYFISFLNNGLY